MEMAVTVSFSLLGCFLLVARAEDFLSSCADQIGNYTANSIYHNNLNTLLSDLTSNTEIDYGFYNFSYGQNADKVNAIGLCRGDIKPDECRTCLNDSRVFLRRLCPNQKEAISYYDKCILRYSNRSIFGLMETSPEFYMWNLNNATEVDQFNQILRNLMKSLRDTAASGDSRRKVAAANITGPSFLYLYGLVQCTPDLSTVECNGCLVGAISEIPNCCKGKKGGRVIRPSCQIRFENYLFYDPAGITSPVPAPQPSPPLPSPSTNNTSSQGNSNTLRITIAIAVPVAVVLMLCVISIYLRLRKHQRRKTTEKEDAGEIKTSESLQFDFKTVRVATDDFADSNKLGQGGFGAVYKGNLANGQAIAVKRLSRDSGQGETEFKNEVLLMAKLQHRNLVRLLGFCLEGRERLLVYEFVPNKSLDHFIFRRSS